MLVGLAVILLGMSILGISDTCVSLVNASIPDADTTEVQSEVKHSSSNSSATAGIRITMTGVVNE